MEPTELETPGKDSQCRTGMCSVRLMKSGCPSCLLLALLILPFELAHRLFNRHSDTPD